MLFTFALLILILLFKMAFFVSLIDRINKIGTVDGDEGFLVNRKRFVVYVAIFMSLGGIIWGIIYLFLEKYYQAAIPFSYVILSILNISYFNSSKNFVFVQGFQTAISLLLPFIFQWSVGGFYESGGVMIWALLSLAASLSYSDFKLSLIWLAFYLVFTVTSGFLDYHYFSVNTGKVNLLLTLNISVVSSLILVLVIFYVKENSKSVNKIRDTHQMLIRSEKLAALGQLSAGIAHEINTPLGAIKAFSEESAFSNKILVKKLFDLNQKLSADSFQNFSKIVETYNPQVNFISTKEEREKRALLQKELESLNINNSRTIAQKLVQIDIFEMNANLIALKDDHFEDVVNVLYMIFINQKNNLSVQIAVGKASRIVQALKMYLHTNRTDISEKFSLEESINTILAIYQNQIKHGINLSIDIPDLPLIEGFVEEINQVWTNLIVNACQAMKFSGNLVIKARPMENYVEIIFKDNGCGIPDQIKDKVFEPFFSTKERGQGTGLGLDIVAKIIEKHQGKIFFTSTVNEGTTFFVQLPYSLNSK